MATTCGPGDAARLAAEAAAQRSATIVAAVGGDGTVHEVRGVSTPHHSIMPAWDRHQGLRMALVAAQGMSVQASLVAAGTQLGSQGNGAGMHDIALHIQVRAARPGRTLLPLQDAAQQQTPPVRCKYSHVYKHHEQPCASTNTMSNSVHHLYQLRRQNAVDTLSNGPTLPRSHRSRQVVNGLMNAAPHCISSNNFVPASSPSSSSGGSTGRQHHKALPALAVVPLGTASDFCKSCGW